MKVFRLYFTLVVFLMVGLLYWGCRKEGLVSAPDTATTRQQALNQWLQSTDPRWFYFMMDRINTVYPKDSIDDRIMYFRRQGDILRRAADYYAAQWKRMGGRQEQLDSARQAFFADSLWRKTPLDASVWKLYGSLAETGAKTEKKMGKRMDMGGELPEVTVNGCSLEPFGYFIDTYFIRGSNFNLIIRADLTLNNCQYKSLEGFSGAYWGLRGQLAFTRDPIACNALRQIFWQFMNDFRECPDDPTPPYTGGGGGSNNGGSDDSGNTQQSAKDSEPANYEWRTKLDEIDGDDRYLLKTTPRFITNPFTGESEPNPEAYNCHYYTFGPNYVVTLADEGWPKWANSIQINGDWSEVTGMVEPGDRVLYFAAYGSNPAGLTHSAIVTEVNSSGLATMVSSKMGEYQILQHHPRDVASGYGVTEPYYLVNGISYPSRKYFRKIN